MRTSTSSACGLARSRVCNSNGADRAVTTAAVIFMGRLPKEKRFNAEGAKVSQRTQRRFFRREAPIIYLQMPKGFLALRAGKVAFASSALSSAFSALKRFFFHQASRLPAG